MKKLAATLILMSIATPAFAQLYPGQPVVVVVQPAPAPIMRPLPCVPIPAAGVYCR
jgi:hypothetical protein